MNALPAQTETNTDQDNNDVSLIERAETIERAIRERLPEYDVHTTQLHPVVAGWMRRALRRNLAQLKKFLEGE